MKNHASPPPPRHDSKQDSSRDTDRSPLEGAARALLIAVIVLLLLVAIAATRPLGASEGAPKALRVDTLATIDGGAGGLSIDREGNVYTSEFGGVLGDPSTSGTRIFMVTPDGESSVFADGLQGASGSGIDSKGNFLQSNIRGNSIVRIPPGGGDPVIVTRETVRAPVGLEVGPDDTLYVANCGGASISEITPEGEASLLVQSRLLNCPNGITRGPDGTLYVSNFQDGNVVAVSRAGEPRVLATIPGNNNGHVVYHEGALYVAGRSAHQIFRVTLDGEVAVFAGSGEKGGADGEAGSSSFCYPNDLGWSPDGEILYVNDVGDHSSEGRILGPTRIRRIWVEG